MKLVFSMIKNKTIFEKEFSDMSGSEGTISFRYTNTAGGIAVIYAPNGTGKSSLADLLNSDISTGDFSFIAHDDAGNTLTPESKMFHVIPDQINRNIIRGNETDYLIGEQIQREYELHDRIEKVFSDAFEKLIKIYKSEFKVSKVNDYLLQKINTNKPDFHQGAYSFMRNIINTQSHGRGIEHNEFINFVRANCNIINHQMLVNIYYMNQVGINALHMSFLYLYRFTVSF